MKKEILFTGLLMITITSSCKSTAVTRDEISNAQNPSTGITGDNSENSLDWGGVYRGVLPCADCEGIVTEITLNPDKTFVQKLQYQGRDTTVFEKRGSFTWNSSGSQITLAEDSNSKALQYFKVGENALFLLDQNGKDITGDTESRYRLVKDTGQITGIYWRLIELNGKPISTEDTPREVHLILSSEEQRAYGNGGCNSFSGSYEIRDGNRIRFSEIATTMMACMNMETESELMKVLEVTDNYTHQNGILSLNKARMAPLAKFEAVYFKK